ncbi:MAG TPA: LysM domain-containing protein [Fusicatenibacter saccharivorans]|nr:LysM domain-containing protein [Fusicatenibacter saccharivorans]
MTCYFVKPGDTLWDIAKKFYTTTDKIRELNELKTETLTPMQQLLVERV